MTSITQLHLLPTKLGEEAMVLVEVCEDVVDQRCLEIEDEKRGRQLTLNQWFVLCQCCQGKLSQNVIVFWYLQNAWHNIKATCIFS